MFSSGCKGIYENEYIRNITGDTIRPGGFRLTNSALKFCDFKKGDKILDIGCGMGATVKYIQDNYGLQTVGIDTSDKLLRYGRNKNPSLNINRGTGEKLTFEKDEMDGVFCECTLSLMTDKKKVLNEIYRVLKPKGYVIISDVYARNPNFIEKLENLDVKSCLRGAHNIEILKEELKEKGFVLNLFEDHSDCLKQMMVDIIFEFGTISNFWGRMGNCSFVSEEFTEAISKSKIGYFLLVGQKL